MLPDQVSNPGPLTYESGALPIALRGPAFHIEIEGKGGWIIGGGGQRVCWPPLNKWGGGLPPPSSYAYAINSLL